MFTPWENCICLENISKEEKGDKNVYTKDCLWSREVPEHVETQTEEDNINVRSVMLIMIELGSLDHSRTACTLSCPSLQSPVSMVCPHLTMSKPGLWFVKGHYVNSTYSYSFHPPSTSISSWFLIFTNCQNWPRFNRWRYACSSGGIGGLNVQLLPTGHPPPPTSKA